MEIGHIVLRRCILEVMSRMLRKISWESCKIELYFWFRVASDLDYWIRHLLSSEIMGRLNDYFVFLL